MATWRVFKQQDPRPLPEGVERCWWEYGTIESEYGSWVSADEVGPVAGAGQYLLIGEDTYPRVIEIEVAAITRYEEIEKPESMPDPEMPGFSVAVTDEQPTVVGFYADEQPK